jgi:hypothetical protein
MEQWVFLFLTVGCLFLTVDAFRSKSPMKDAPYSTIPSLWKRGLRRFSLMEQDKMQSRLAFPLGGIGLGLLAWVFLAMTILLAILTVRAFLE